MPSSCLKWLGKQNSRNLAVRYIKQGGQHHNQAATKCINYQKVHHQPPTTQKFPKSQTHLAPSVDQACALAPMMCKACTSCPTRSKTAEHT